MTLVDTNVLLDIATNDPRWVSWSLYQLDAAAIRGPVIINAVIYAEFSIGYTRIEEVEQVLSDAGLEIEKFHDRHYFLPARCFSGIEREGDVELECCPISSSARTRRWPD